MNNTKHSHLITFYEIQVKGKKHYITPHPDTIRELLKRFHNIDIGRRWHFQCTHDLEEGGYISRVKRPVFNRETGVFSRPSIFSLTVKGLKYLISKGVSGARALLKPMFDWLHRNDNRRPTAADLYPGETITSREAALEKLKELIKVAEYVKHGGIPPLNVKTTNN